VKPPEPLPWKYTVEPEPGQYAWLVAEKVKPVGAVGGVVSIWIVVDWTEEALPTLSVLNHLIVSADEIPNEVDAELTVVAVPLVVGSLPSVVYVIVATPEPPSEAVMPIVTGMLFVQPPGQALPSQVSELVGAAESDWAVKLLPVLESPALFWAVTDPLCVPALLLKV
jgi:hypothetical protein